MSGALSGLSVVIPAHNAESTIAAQLDSLLRTPRDGLLDVIVVDDRSTDGTSRLVRDFSRVDPRVRLASADGGMGPGYARNIGVQRAAGSALAFCDADDVVGEWWVRAVSRALRQWEFVTGPLDLARLNPPWLAASRGETYGKRLMTLWERIPYTSSCNLGIRRSTFEKVGGFDESFPIGDDIDFCVRAWRQGVELRFVPEAVVHYRYRRTMRGLWEQATTYGAVYPRLCRRLARDGLASPRRLGGWRTWLWLARRLHLVATQGGRARWIWVAGNKLGQLEGSIRHGTLYI